VVHVYPDRLELVGEGDLGSQVMPFRPLAHQEQQQERQQPGAASATLAATEGGFAKCSAGFEASQASKQEQQQQAQQDEQRELQRQPVAAELATGGGAVTLSAPAAVA
jgi:hypothetical protein